VEHATAYAARKGWTVDPAHVYQDDGVSGAEFERRTGLTALLVALRPRPVFDVVLMAEPSRLGREQIETAYTLKRITDAGVAVWYYLEDRRAAMDSALAKVMASLSGFASESERELARARTYDALARKAQAGHVAGGVVFGYVNVRVDGHVERQILEPEAATVRRIFARYAAGAGLKRIAAELIRDGAPAPVPRRKDRQPGWSASAILPMLSRALYIGIVTWGATKKVDVAGRTCVRRYRPDAERIRVEVPELRIIPADLWETVQARRARKTVIRPGWTRHDGPPALLAGIGKCQCGAALTRHVRTHGSKGRSFPVHMYGCSRRPRCTSTEIAIDRVNAAVLDALAEALKPETLEAAVRQAVEDERAARAGSADRRVALERDLRGIQARIDRLTEAVAAGTAAMAPLRAKLAEEEGRRQELERERAALTGLDGAAELATAALRRALLKAAARVREGLHAHPAEARDVLAAFVPRIEFTPFGNGRARGFEFEGIGDYGALTGNTPIRWCPRRDSNPCFRAASVARFKIRELRHSGHRITAGDGNSRCVSWLRAE
jgi:site-specific DNA recombinase